jgi:cellulose synthase (UDP-forming)
LPSAGEDLAVLLNTYEGVRALDYPGVVNVLVLDDSDRRAVQRLAEQHAFTYLVRPNRGHMKKAGNLKHGFDHSDGEVIVIFDADFVPRPDFLRELMPYLDDPTIAIVQSPQFFDTAARLPWLQRSAGAVQESFYRWAQPSRDALGAPICVGTCALYRRTALNESGGFAQIGHSEDVHTGVNLMKVGYRTMYIPVVLAKGLCPDRMPSFISQQYRWCAGSMSLLVDKAFHDSPLTYRQRMCFFTGFGYYISTAIGVVLLSLPTIIMLWFLPDRVHLSNFFWVLPTLALYPLIAIMHKSSWTPSCLRVYTISSFSHALAIWHVMRGRPAEWVPTGESRKTSMTSTVTAMMLVWLFLTETMMAAGIARFLLSGRSIIDVGPVLIYAALNAYICVPIGWTAWQDRRLRKVDPASSLQQPNRRPVAWVPTMRRPEPVAVVD